MKQSRPASSVLESYQIYGHTLESETTAGCRKAYFCFMLAAAITLHVQLLFLPKQIYM